MCLHSFPTAVSAFGGQRSRRHLLLGPNATTRHTTITLPAAHPHPMPPPPFNTPLSPPTELLSKHTRSSQSCLLCCSIYGQMRRLDTREPNTTFTANCSGMMKWPIWCGCTVCRTASYVVRFRQIHHGRKISKPLVQ